MITITADTPVDSWFASLNRLIKDKQANSDKFYCDYVALIKILNPCLQPVPKEYPMSQNDIDIINRYLVSGEDEDKVCHEWTKIYYHRIYDMPNSQYKYLLDKLRLDPCSGRAQISMWDKSIDQSAVRAPCTQIIWCRIKSMQLEMHVHASSVDAYKKLLMNQQEFIALQQNLAFNLNISMGSFYHFIDSFHIYNEDLNAIRALSHIKVLDL